MDFILLFIIVIQFVYIVYKDISFNKERESHLLKIMSKNITEYKEAVEESPGDSTVPEEDFNIPIETASIEEILNAKVNI